jgi:ribonuclease HI
MTHIHAGLLKHEEAEIFDEAVRLDIWTDGSANNRKPGRIAWSVCIRVFSQNVHTDTPLFTLFDYETHPTGLSPFAEMMAINLGLVDSERFSNAKVKIISDSEWAVRILNGEYKAKKFLEEWAIIRNRLSTFQSWEIVHVRGHSGILENEWCDKIADQARRNGHVNIGEIING